MREKLAAELAGMKLCPGNESHKYAKTIIDLVRKFDEEEEIDVTDQIIRDGLDIEELKKNDKAIMEGIVSMSKLVTAMHDTLKRMCNDTAVRSPDDVEGITLTVGKGGPVVRLKNTAEGNQEGTITR